MAFFRTINFAEPLPIIEGDGVVLRTPQMTDFEEWAALRATPEGKLRHEQVMYAASDVEFMGEVAKLVAVAVENALNFDDAQALQQVWCPHTATAAEVYWNLPKPKQANHWVIVSTAHPAKFNDIVEPLIGRSVPVPPPLAQLLSLPRYETEIEPQLSALRTQLLRGAA